MTHREIAILAAGREHLPEVQRLARTIWHTHYPGIIAIDQIEYMLDRGYALDVLESFIGAQRRGIYLALVDGSPSGFAAWYATDDPADAKLDKLYILQRYQRLGLGRRLIAAVAAAARSAKATTLILNVNKHNTQAIRAYEKCGFAIRAAVVVDIGHGYVMDDFVMYRTLAANRAPSI